MKLPYEVKRRKYIVMYKLLLSYILVVTCMITVMYLLNIEFSILPILFMVILALVFLVYTLYTLFLIRLNDYVVINGVVKSKIKYYFSRDEYFITLDNNTPKIPCRRYDYDKLELNDNCIVVMLYGRSRIYKI